MNVENVTYIDSFGAKHIPKRIKKKIIANEAIMTNIYKIKACDSIFVDTFVLNLLISC